VSLYLYDIDAGDGIEGNWSQRSLRIHAPGTTSANPNGFATLNAVMNEADGSLAAYGLTPSGSPERAHQEALKNALDDANNNKNFVQPAPNCCPKPVF
jgi:hypothetical protein